MGLPVPVVPRGGAPAVWTLVRSVGAGAAAVAPTHCANVGLRGELMGRWVQLRMGERGK